MAPLLTPIDVAALAPGIGAHYEALAAAELRARCRARVIYLLFQALVSIVRLRISKGFVVCGRRRAHDARAKMTVDFKLVCGEI
jgi:hypothetical protein